MSSQSWTKSQTKANKLHRQLSLVLGGLYGKSKKELCTRSFYHFVKEFWTTCERKFVDGWHIKAICDHLQALYEGRIRNLLINIPPRHGKSLLINVFFPAWCWAKNPEKRFLFFSYAKSLTIRDSLKCRQVIQSEKFKNMFGDMFSLLKDQNAKGRFANDKGGVRIASSVGGSATGEGGDIIGIDDPHNAYDITSDTIRESVIEDFWKGALSTRDDDPKTTARILVMQRLHNMDLTGYILKFEAGDWTILILPIRFDPKHRCITSIGFQDPRQQKGDLLWPERYSKENEAKLRARLGSFRAAGQLDQRPEPIGGGILKKKWWKRDKLHPHKRAELCQEIIQSWDMPFKKKIVIKKNGEEGGSDYLACFVLGRIGADIYLLDLLMVRAEFTEALIYVKQMTKKWPTARLKLMEDKAYAPAVMSALKPIMSGMLPIEPKGDKVMRVLGCAPVVECGNMHVPEDNECWVSSSAGFTPDEFIERAAKFPALEHDDDMDAWSQGTLHLQGDELPFFELLGAA